MIGVKLQGRMGNQMFQYAFAYAVARERGDSFCLIPDSKFRLHYFEFNTFWFRVFNKLKLILLRSSFKPKPFFTQTGHEQNVEVKSQVNKYERFDGFFQSESFFKVKEAEIKERFQIKTKYLELFSKKYASLFENNKTIIVHIRLTDYKTWDMGAQLGGPVSALPFSYVEDVLSKFDVSKYKVIFISDDISSVRSHFGDNKNFMFEHNEEILDFQLLLNADVLCLSNSSFSWWGAYLNKKPSKKVFAPENWLGFMSGIEYPKGIICEGWESVTVKKK